MKIRVGSSVMLSKWYCWSYTTDFHFHTYDKYTDILNLDEIKRSA